MAVQPDGVRIDRRIQPLGNCPAACAGQDGIAGQASLEAVQQRVLHPVGRSQPGAEAYRGLGLARLEDIGEMLRVSVETQVGDAEIGPQQIAGFDHRIAPKHTVGTLALDAHRRVEPWRQALRGERFAIPPFDIGGGGRPGRDDRA